ncbi:hypothetical protein Dip518_000011 [Parelusimicrobium proximum]|uniref:hypothetical protein n=1 Tax=Parelusimicrobium proximum TaxID=3228953 RepID=UPI003D1740DA
MRRGYCSIYTPNLINADTEILSPQSVETKTSGDIFLDTDLSIATLNIRFAGENGYPKKENFDRIFILGSNITSISVSARGNEIYSAASLVGTDELLSFPLLSAEEISITFSASQSIYIEKLIICRSLINMGNMQTSYTKSENSKSGHFYVNSGELVAWKEYSKCSCAMNIYNITREVKKRLFDAFEEYTLLTFSLNGELDRSEVYEFALTKAGSEKVDRATGRYEISISLVEK